MNERAYSLILIPFGERFLALTLEDFTKALRLGQEIAGLATTEPLMTASVEKLLDAEGASQMTGVPSSWFLEAARHGKIPHIKAGKYVRFRMADVIQALEVRSGRRINHTARMPLVQKAGKPK